MKRETFILPLVIALLAAIPAAGQPKETVLRDTMRRLLQDNVTLIRTFVVRAATDVSQREAACQRLLENAVDIGNGIKPYYGSSAADRLSALLIDHALAFTDLVAAAKTRNKADLRYADRVLLANADSTAALLAEINPDSWPEPAGRDLLRSRVELIDDEATAELRGDRAASLSAHDKLQAQASQIADILSDGIIKQFNEKF